MKLEFSTDFLKKYSNIKFCENPLSGSRVVADGQIGMTKLIAVFRNFAKASKISEFSTNFVFTHFVRSFQPIATISLYALHALYTVMWAFEQNLYV